MPRKRTDVETIREILRLSYELKLSIRKIAEALEISKTSIGEYLAEFKRTGLSYEDIITMCDKEVLELFEKSNKASNPMYETLSGEFPNYEKELARVGVTLFLLWEEYKERYPDGFSYSRFCHHYRMWESKLKAGMHIEHKAGDLTYIDFTGRKMHYIEPATGEVHDAEIFLTVLGASQLIYVEAVKASNCKTGYGPMRMPGSIMVGLQRAYVPIILNRPLPRHAIMNPCLIRPMMILPGIIEQ